LLGSKVVSVMFAVSCTGCGMESILRNFVCSAREICRNLFAGAY
jgi:hypothetical protein